MSQADQKELSKLTYLEGYQTAFINEGENGTGVEVRPQMASRDSVS